MSHPELRADCARCCGLCCVASAFDADQGFGFDKPAHAACPNLDAQHRCAIHPTLRAHGFPACATFDCFGAGQWVTQQLFGGNSWRASPEIAQHMFTLYPRYRALHELMAMLDMAIGQLPAAEAAPLQRCLFAIGSICQSGGDLADTDALGTLRQQAGRLLRWARERRKIAQ